MLLYFYVKQIPTFWTWLIIPKVKLMYFIQPKEEGEYSHYISSSIFLCTFIHYILCMQNVVFALFRRFLHDDGTIFQMTPMSYIRIFSKYTVLKFRIISKNMIISITKYLKVNQLDQNIFLKYNVNFWGHPWKYN